MHVACNAAHVQSGGAERAFRLDAETLFYDEAAPGPVRLRLWWSAGGEVGSAACRLAAVEFTEVMIGPAAP